MTVSENQVSLLGGHGNEDYIEFGGIQGGPRFFKLPCGSSCQPRVWLHRPQLFLQCARSASASCFVLLALNVLRGSKGSVLP